jgi:Outer membrane protein
MKKLLTCACLMLALTFMSTTISAQKFGYVNSQLLLSEMSEVEQAKANLEVLGQQLRKKGEAMVADLQAKYADAQKKAAEGTLSPKAQEEELAKLKTKEQEIAQFEQDMLQQLQKKEADLLQPIYDKVNTAIKAVAEEEGYVFIFDGSTQVLLYADETTDVSSKVKAKLGM